MKINPNDPATGFGYSNEQLHQSTSGITIRTQIATMAMQGMLSDNKNYGNGSAEDTARESVAYADALIKKLNETSNEREIPIVPPKDREILNEG